METFHITVHVLRRRVKKNRQNHCGDKERLDTKDSFLNILYSRFFFWCHFGINYMLVKMDHFPTVFKVNNLKHL